jgi:hypothetical protein
MATATTPQASAILTAAQQSFQSQNSGLKNGLKVLIGHFKTFVYGGFDALDMSIGGTMLVLGLCTSNYAMMVFLFGYLIIVPIFGLGINFILKLLGINEFATHIGMSSYFISYLMFNAQTLYSYQGKKAPEDSTLDLPTGTNLDEKKDNRANKAISSMFYISIFALIMIIMEIYKIKNQPNIFITLIALVALVAFFVVITTIYYFIVSLSSWRKHLDLFGISNRLLPNSALQDSQFACFQSPPPTVIPPGGSSCPT